MKTLNIGDTVLDSDNAKCTIVDITVTDVKVRIPSKTGKAIGSAQWFKINEFWKRFNPII